MTWVCSGCGTPSASRLPFACVHEGLDGADHVLTRRGGAAEWPGGDEPNPFIRYRRLLWAWELAQEGGLADAEYVALATRLDDRVAEVDGHGFRVTPLHRRELDGATLWLKDETGNVAGSHKGRHLMGVLLALEVEAALGRPRAAPLAIASCGNAALAAAVLARAAGRPIDVFIPTDADPAVVERLRALEARLHVCARQPGIAGDPCTHAFRAAVAAGALPFSCQGSDCGLTIDGGRTLGYELVEAGPLDALFVQVGGGALGSALAQALDEAVALGAVPRAPRLYTVQTEGCHPLERALARVRARASSDGGVDAALAHARTHRAAYMAPWPETPHSIAHGILDDETYDWYALVAAMMRGGGDTLVVDEAALLDARALGRATAPVDATGAAGLAGVLTQSRAGALPAGSSVAAILSGRQR
jgi:threonine dehydratase